MTHPVDLLASAVLTVDRRRLGIFQGGWGPEDALGLFTRMPSPADVPEPVEIVWSRKEERRGFRVRRGRFTSPVRDLLPREAGSVPVEFLEPGAGSGRLCILLPAWNDHGFTERRRLALLLARRRISTLSFDIPLYGERRTVPHPAQAIRTVGEFGLMGFGAIQEGRSLVETFASTHRVGVTGYSMGGNLAALVSATVPRPVATAPLAASHSPAPVYLDGALRRAIAWKPLGGRESEARLRAVLGSVTVLDLPPLPHHGSAVVVAGRRDGFVPPEASRALADHWLGSEMVWVDAGHATLLWRHRDLLADAVVRAFDRLEETG